MPRRFLVTAVLFASVLASCAPSPPLWRQDARIVLDASRLEGADKTFPAEYDSAQDAFDRGEALLSRGDREGAETYYHFAFLKAQLLEQNYAAEKVRRAEEAQRRIREETHEVEKQRALLDEQRRASQARTEAAEVRARVEKPRQQPKERLLPTHHTVKRGETLPQIAAMPDVYGDYRLWPLLYRANRDQISDPRHLWPGQLLRIPRNLSHDEIGEARRYAQVKPL